MYGWDGRSAVWVRLEALPPEILNRIPERFRTTVAGLQGLWPGRIVLRSMAKFAKLELFDRSMTIAAQFFTSVFPVLILSALAIGKQDSGKLADLLILPEQTQSVLTDAPGGDASTTFGLVGFLIVFVSGTSLSRALTRASAVIWELPSPKNRLSSVWRWVAVLMVVALVAANLALAVFIPWLLLEGRVGFRLLVPGAVLFGVAMGPSSGPLPWWPCRGHWTRVPSTTGRSAWPSPT